MSYKRTCWNQFNLETRPCYIPNFILTTFEDNSWGNETCPHFDNEELLLTIWVDFDSPTDREWEDGKKYTVVEILNWEERENATSSVFETDNEEELKTFCREWQLHKIMKRAQFELAAVLEGLYQLPESDFRNYRISLVENCIDDFTEACEMTDTADKPSCSPAGEPC